MADGEALGLGSQGVPMTRREALAAGAGAAVLGTLAVETAHARTASAATHMLPSVVGMDALELSRAIRRREVSCVEVMDAYLDHIERLNPRVNAIVSLQDRDDLMAQARRRDVQLSSGLDARLPPRRQGPGGDEGHPHDAGLADLPQQRPGQRRPVRRAPEGSRHHRHREDQHP